MAPISEIMKSAYFSGYSLICNRYAITPIFDKQDNNTSMI